MTCYDCKYHHCTYGTHFCYSPNRKRRKKVRISEEDCKKDIPCSYSKPDKLQNDT